MKLEYAIKSLSDLFFKVSGPSQFNDPFECRGRYVNFDVPLRQYVHDNYERLRFEAIRITGSDTQELQDRFTEDFLFNTYFESAAHSLDAAWLHAVNAVVFMLCFVKERGLKPTSDVLFWSHYADSGKGVRITFDFPMSNPSSIYYVREVEYQDDVPVFDCVNMPNWLKGDAFKAYIEEISHIKGKAWEYENEIRMIIPKRISVDILKGKRHLREEKIKGEINTFVKVEPEVIRRVDFGPRVDKRTAEEIMCAMKRMGVYDHVKFFQVGFNTEKYWYEYRQIT